MKDHCDYQLCKHRFNFWSRKKVWIVSLKWFTSVSVVKQKPQVLMMLTLPVGKEK